MKLLMSKQLNGQLKPCYDSDAELLKKIKAGDEVECEIKRPRNYKFLKKFMALINLCFHNQEQFSNIDDLRAELTIEAGYYVSYYNLQGVETRRPKSISFASMEEDEFEKLYSDVLDVIIKYFHYTKEDIDENLISFF